MATSVASLTARVEADMAKSATEFASQLSLLGGELSDKLVDTSVTFERRLAGEAADLSLAITLAAVESRDDILQLAAKVDLGVQNLGTRLQHSVQQVHGRMDEEKQRLAERMDGSVRALHLLQKLMGRPDGADIF